MILNLLKDLSGKPLAVSASDADRALSKQMSAEELRSLEDFGASNSELQKLIAEQTTVNYDRINLYRDLERAIQHPMISAALKVYASICTTYNRTANATVWASGQLSGIVNSFLDQINIEEKVYDWTHNTANMGDFFVRVRAVPGQGIIYVDDSYLPSQVCRLDYQGRLIGFFSSKDGVTPDNSGQIYPPWEFVHFRIMGAAKRRYQTFGAPYLGNYSTLDMASGDRSRISTKYGVSLLQEALPIYKRLRLGEDMMMMARVSKSVLRFLYMMKYKDGTDVKQMKVLNGIYKAALKRNLAVNIDSGAPNFESRMSELAVNDDIFMGMLQGEDMKVEKLGGEADIKAIRDIDQMERQMANALGLPLYMLGGDSSNRPLNLGQNSMERLEIAAARNSRQLQRSIIVGITQLVRIHLAWRGMNTDQGQFNIHMSETSTAEEEELKDALKSGVEATEMFYDMLVKVVGEKNMPDVSKRKVFKYLQNKFLGGMLADLDLDDVVAHISKLPSGDIEKPEGDQGSQNLAEPVGGAASPAAEIGKNPTVMPNVRNNTVQFGEAADLNSMLPVVAKRKKLVESKDGGSPQEVDICEHVETGPFYEQWKDVKLKEWEQAVTNEKK